MRPRAQALDWNQNSPSGGDCENSCQPGFGSPVLPSKLGDTWECSVESALRYLCHFHVLCQSSLSCTQPLQDRNPQTTFNTCRLLFFSITKISVPSIHQMNLMKSVSFTITILNNGSLTLSIVLRAQGRRVMSDSWGERLRDIKATREAALGIDVTKGEH